jgi:polysaccharide export outer membrane protein
MPAANRLRRVLPWLAIVAAPVVAILLWQHAQPSAPSAGDRATPAEQEAAHVQPRPAGHRPLAPYSQPADADAAPSIARREPVFEDTGVQLCQLVDECTPQWPVYGDCASGSCGPAMPWQSYAQGEYVGHVRTPHVDDYRLRVDDQLEFVYRLTREETTRPYELNVGDEIRVESLADDRIGRNLVVQPDGTITLMLLGQVKATRRTIQQLRDDIEELYRRYYQEPSITVTPIKVNTLLEDLRATVDNRFGAGGQSRDARVAPDGTVSLPAVGQVPVQGLSLSELKTELDARYRATVEGIEVIPVLVARAPRYVYVLGEVRTPGRFEMTGPTTLMQSIALAGGWHIGAGLRQVVVFRRGDDWRLLATKVNIYNPLVNGNPPCPCGEIWLNDSDVIVVPKSPVLQMNEFIELVFTRGIYGVVPFEGIGISMAKLSTL